MALDFIRFVSSASREEISKDFFGGCMGGVITEVFFLLLLGILQGVYLKNNQYLRKHLKRIVKIYLKSNHNMLQIKIQITRKYIE
jgi:hypothetical protein